MTLDAKDLYQQLVLDHGKKPRNEGPLEGATHEATTKNPLCGDRVTLRLRVEGDRVLLARFEARGCMISRASASLLTEAVVDRTASDALDLAAAIDAMVNEGSPPAVTGDLAALAGVRDFPSRKPCVLLAWQALRNAIAAHDPAR